jgi:hypothetical protein
LYDAQAALVQIGKALGIFVDKMEHSGPGGGPIQTQGSVIVLPDNSRGDRQPDSTGPDAAKEVVPSQ